MRTHSSADAQAHFLVAMLRVVVLAVFAVAALSGSASAGWFDVGETGNKFLVHYDLLPLKSRAFFTMPRTTEEAQKDSFAQVAERQADRTTVWCRSNDYRVCVLFDAQGSVAGIQMSAAVAEIEKSNQPVDMNNGKEWYRQTLLGQDVYTYTVFFVDKSVLLAGGRPIADDTLTAPDGIYVLQTDVSGTEQGRLHVPAQEDSAVAAGFGKQACFHGMGNHYFMGLTPEAKCENHRPYFTLYRPKTHTMNGFGFVMYGKVSKGRGWFETPPAFIAKTIAPNSPQCMTDWIKTYGLFTMHVYFDEKPWNTWC